MKHEREMKGDKDGKVGREQERRSERATEQNIRGCNYLVMGDKMTQEETEVWKVLHTNARYDPQSASCNNSQLQLEAVSHLCTAD